MLPDEFSPERTTRYDAHSNAAAAAFLARLERVGEDPVEAFLDHVRTTVPYYQRLVSEGAELAHIDQFPIVTQSMMRAAPEQFLSTAFSADEMSPTHTSGTLGPSFKVWFDRASFFDVHCFAWARIADAIPGMMDRMRIPCETPRLHVITDRRSFIRRTLHNPALAGQAIQYWPIGELDSVDEATVAALRAADIDILVGKPHVLRLLARRDAALPGGRIRPRALVTAAEKLYRPDFVRLREHFGCDIVDAYAATESGLVGVACRHRTGHHVETDRVSLEILDENGEVQPEGTGALIVTNLMNWAQPFIRYQLGDYVSLRWTDCECGVEGPTLDMVSRDVRRYTIPSIGEISTSALEDILDRAEVEEFQVSQEGEQLHIRWVAAADVDPNFEFQLEHELRTLLATHFTLHRVASTVEPGGKVLRFVTTRHL